MNRIEYDFKRLAQKGISKLTRRRILTGLKINSYDYKYIGINKNGVGTYYKWPTFTHPTSSNIKTEWNIEELQKIGIGELDKFITHKHRNRFKSVMEAINKFVFKKDFCIEKVVEKTDLVDSIKNTKIIKIGIQSGSLYIKIDFFGSNIHTQFLYPQNVAFYKIIQQFEKEFINLGNEHKKRGKRIIKNNQTVLDTLNTELSPYLLIDSL
jgi:hypothetical protein